MRLAREALCNDFRRAHSKQSGSMSKTRRLGDRPDLTNVRVPWLGVLASPCFDRLIIDCEDGLSITPGRRTSREALAAGSQNARGRGSGIGSVLTSIVKQDDFFPCLTKVY